ncbi:hypothetical protein [uncultured Amnibacterium sp.]|uniref:family 4 glycosyl hydrolase n=1 Tax=uncultured Amnibacterium sp. TaxID=1631851 RepID=UPI0035C9F9A0
MRVLTLIGAGSAVFTRGLLADLIAADDLGAWEIRLVDVAPEPLRVAARLAEAMVAARGAGDRFRVVAATDRTTVLPGSDYVVTCVGVGGRPAWQRDDEVNRSFGIRQPVGDSIMPGGISRLLRTTPVLVEVARDVAGLAPAALFFNYSNPMTANVQAIERYAGAAVVGLCHGVIHIQRELAALAGAPFERTSSLYAGINHLTFIYDLRVDGKDAWPAVRERVRADLAGPPPADSVGSIFPAGANGWNNPFGWQLFERYGAFPAAGDRHVTEFFPEHFRNGAYYGLTLGDDAFALPEILQWGEDRYRGMRDQADGVVPIDDAVFERSGGEQEQLIAIIRAIDADSRATFSCNVLNRGLIAGLPPHAAVEVPGVATARGIVPMAVPGLSTALTAILARRLSSVDLALEGAMTGDRALVAEAMLLDGGVPDAATAAALTDALIEAQAEHLPRFR